MCLMCPLFSRIKNRLHCWNEMYLLYSAVKYFWWFLFYSLYKSWIERTTSTKCTNITGRFWQTAKSPRRKIHNGIMIFMSEHMWICMSQTLHSCICVLTIGSWTLTNTIKKIHRVVFDIWHRNGTEPQLND